MIGNHPTIEGGLALTITTLCYKFKDDLINEAKESKADLPTVLHWVQATNRHSDLM